MNQKYKLGLLGLILVTILGVSSITFAKEEIEDLIYDTELAESFVLLQEDEEDEDEDDHAQHDADEEFDDEDDFEDEEHHELDGPIIRTHTVESASSMGENHRTMHSAPAIHQPESASYTAVASGDWSTASTWQNGAATLYRDRRSPDEVATMTSQLFLGVRLECAKCTDVHF